METALLSPSPPIGALLDGRLDTIQRMDPKLGQAAAARELQVAFFAQLIQAMRRTLPENSLLPRSPSRDVYDGLFDRELAGVLAENDPLGLVSRLGGESEKDPAGPARREGAPGSGGAEESRRVEGAPGAVPGSMISVGSRPRIIRGEPSEMVPAMAVPPIRGALSSPYGPRQDPVTGGRGMHRGMDLAASTDTPISAVAAGRVVASGWAGPSGHRVVIDHADGYRSVYAHANRTLVGVNDRVVAGQVIATVGSSGRATGPHLHFEVHKNGVSLDPARAVLTSDAMRRAVLGAET